jgi:uncharacterized protein YdaU (DUF1376 family)
MSSIPYLPIYTDTYLATTPLLSLEEHGAYYLLMQYLWINGGKLPNSDFIIAKYFKVTQKKWQKLKKILQKFFVFSDEFITHSYIDQAYKKMVEKRRKYSQNARSRWSQTAEDQGSGQVDMPPEANVKIAPEVPDHDSNLPPPGSCNGILHARVSQAHIIKNNNIASFSYRELVDKSEVAAIAAATLTQVDTLFTKMNLPMPEDAHLVQEWVGKGANPARDILPIVEKLLQRNQRRQVSPPRSFSYFTPAIAIQMQQDPKTFQKSQPPHAPKRLGAILNSWNVMDRAEHPCTKN